MEMDPCTSYRELEITSEIEQPGHSSLVHHPSPAPQYVDHHAGVQTHEINRTGYKIAKSQCQSPR